MELIRSRAMKEIRLTYHQEDGIWWVNSDDVPCFYAAADTFDEARREAREGLSFALESNDFVVCESFDNESQFARTWSGGINDAFIIVNNVAESSTATFPIMSNFQTKLSDILISSISSLKHSSVMDSANSTSFLKMKALA
jgi:predicted RNase H-like HicB family nuclease